MIKKSRRQQATVPDNCHIWGNDEEEAARPVEKQLDPKVREALGVMADKVRGRARERTDELKEELAGIIGVFMEDYPNCSRHDYLRGLGTSWDGLLSKLCEALYQHIGDVDVERSARNLSDKILALEKPVRIKRQGRD
jgi:hypothetical protein